MEAWDEQGRSLTDEVGELVITEPMPSMPLFLWGDEDGERLRESYFSMYPGHLAPRRLDPHHARAAARSSTGARTRPSTARACAWAPARSTGRRAGCDEVLDALVVDIPARDGDGELRMLLFVVLREGAELDDELTAAIKRRIREDCSPRHVPNEMLQIDQVPRTLSGKVLEVPVKRILMGAAPSEAASVDSLADPRSLDYFVELAKTL